MLYHTVAVTELYQLKSFRTHLAALHCTFSNCCVLLGQAKLIQSLSSGNFENHMQAGGHFSYLIT